MYKKNLEIVKKKFWWVGFFLFLKRKINWIEYTK
jgi:hypothetical protein